MSKTHRAVIAHAAGHVYARCTCGWEGTHRPVARGSFDNAQALRATDHEAIEHTKEAAHDARAQ